ncbi:keratin, type I cytoskeletal 9-like [Gigantopelta aegis]|uniref:keratin, type I cytoskeletal 9-like n=1 Tax=Gigantopelta aegis TaxID=1735272 RepID=UPI001B889D1A|nr:keratin, type I cytoskeletal 9-like [Gigantopelta aegis]XP_041360746.1 keratin, type I cytoskeletal 9-like [Gigantopelta aegis]XP_041360747.1 keratin, type I cytoskeletal 9-like [Gigantopelta aegis]
MSGREREKRRCLEVLGLPNSASEDDIKKTYRSLARQHHPDKNDGEDATQRFQEISYAYKYLIEGPPNTGHHGDSFECGIPVEILIRLFPWLFTGRTMFNPFERPRFRPSPFFMYDSSDDDDEYYEFCFHDNGDDNSDSDCRPRERAYTPSNTAGNKNVNAKKERRREKKKRYEERRKQAKKADSSQPTGAARNTSESRKDFKSESAGIKSEGKENCFPSESARQKSTADKEQSECNASAKTKTQDEKPNEQDDKTQAQNSSKPTEGKKNVAETIASSWSNASQNMSEKIQNKEKKKKIQAEERKREKEILEIRRELERQEEIKAQKLAQKKEQEKRLAEERRKREAEEEEREMERLEMEKKEMERKEMERKEMEKKEIERKEMERREMEKKEMERQEMERRQEEYRKAQFTQDFQKVDKKNKVNKTKPMRPLKKFPSGNKFSVLADVDDETLLQTMTESKSTGVGEKREATKSKTIFDIESSMTMDALDDISDNEDLLLFASKNSFWCDPAMSGSGSSASKQGHGQPEKSSGRPESEKQKNKTFTFEASNRNSNNAYGKPTQGQGSTQSGFHGNVPQAATSTPVMCWADEMDDVDDGAISGSSPNTGDSLKQQPNGSYYNNVRGSSNNKQANGFRGYGGNNRGASRGYGRNNGGAAATSRNTTGASQGYGGNHKGASQNYGGNYTGASWVNGENNSGASTGYGGNNRGASQGNGGNNRGASTGYGGNNRGGNNTGAPQGYGGNNRGAPQGFGGNTRGAQRGYGGNTPRGNGVFHNQQQSYYSGGPIQYSGGYGNQNFSSVGGRGFRFPNSNQQRPYGAPQQGYPFANRFTYY